MKFYTFVVFLGSVRRRRGMSTLFLLAPGELNHECWFFLNGIKNRVGASSIIKKKERISNVQNDPQVVVGRKKRKNLA